MTSHSSLPTKDDDDSVGLELASSGSNKTPSMRFKGKGLEEATLVWQSISKFVDESKGVQKSILTNISGAAKPGETIALMGPSGSGKTTLLNILGGRGLQNVSGSVFINNVKFNKSMRKAIAYVLQEDIFFTQLTVREQLTITSHLRLPSTLTNEEKEAAVNRIIAILRIEKCSNTKIMLVSGGEKKRCNIGSELLTNPSIILLDEPTSGLDANGASALMETLKGLANDRMTVISSIHQPSSKVFYSFNKLLLLADGHIVFSGPPSRCLKYLEKLGYVPLADYNPADFVMDLVAVVTSDDDAAATTTTSMMKAGGAEVVVVSNSTAGAAVSDSIDGTSEGGVNIVVESGTAAASTEVAPSARAVLIASWDNDASYAEATKALQDGDGEVRDSESAGFAASASRRVVVGGSSSGPNGGNTTTTDLSSIKYMASYHVQFVTLLFRAMIVARSNIVTNLQFINTIGMGLISGFCWFRMEYTEDRVNDRAGFIFFFMTFWFFMTLFQGMMQFLPERAIMLKERAAGSYRLSAYFLSKTISETPVRLLLPFLYVVISYPMTTLNSSVSVFFAVVGAQLLAALAGESVGLFIGTSTLDYEKAMVTATLVSLAMMLTGGYFVQQLPDFVHWIRYISPFKYSYDACLLLVFNRDVPCDGGLILADCSDGRSSIPGSVVARDYLGATQSVAFNYGMLIVFIMGFRIAAYLALKFIPHNNGGRL